MGQLSTDEIKKIREQLIRVYSADVYDTLDAMGYGNQCLSLAIKPLKNDMKLAGPALTILGTTEPLYDDELKVPEFDDFAMFDKFYEGCVVVINAERDDQVGHWGEMMSYGARNSGASGVVIDGGTRDKAGILRIQNWSCFARYTSPVESKRRWRCKTLEEPIYMSGTLTKYVRVNPGDWLVGDCDAVMVIPQEILLEALPKIMDIYTREEASRKELAAGAPLKTVVKKYNRA
jgi:Demethylmenaquinone methyltransferase